MAPGTVVIAAAFYETAWFEAIIYVVVALVAARVVDSVLKRRDAAMERLLGKRPGRADRTRYVMLRRLVVVAILGSASPWRSSSSRCSRRWPAPSSPRPPSSPA